MTSVQKRVYVGNILQNDESCLIELYDRFTKFGRCLSDEFEKHDTFAYINMEFNDESQFQRLKKSFNNVRFKGNELRVNLAKPSWQTAWKQRHEEDEKESRKQEKIVEKRDWEYHKKIENIRMSWDDRKVLISGRVRKNARPKAQIRNATFRVNVGGSLKVYKCYKTKLWGYERNKDPKDLVCKFVNNKWRDGYDHIVDRLDYSRSKKSIRSVIEQQPSTGNIDGTDDVEIEEEEKEKEKVKDVLATVLRDFEFDKPLQLSDDEDFALPSNKKVPYHHHSNTTETMEEGSKEKQLLPSAPLQEEPNQDQGKKMEEEEDDDEEFIPTFSQKNASEGQVTGEEINNTETLRSLFNPEFNDTPSSFKLIDESDEDIDHQNDQEVDEVTATPQEILQSERAAHGKEKQHLFFPHFDSPFLIGQTKLSKLKNSDVTETLHNWDEIFWENRGTWTKEMKRRQRDAQRLLNKKKARKNGGILL